MSLLCAAAEHLPHQITVTIINVIPYGKHLPRSKRQTRPFLNTEEYQKHMDPTEKHIRPLFFAKGLIYFLSSLLLMIFLILTQIWVMIDKIQYNSISYRLLFNKINYLIPEDCLYRFVSQNSQPTKAAQINI